MKKDRLQTPYFDLDKVPIFVGDTVKVFFRGDIGYEYKGEVVKKGKKFFIRAPHFQADKLMCVDGMMYQCTFLIVKKEKKDEKFN